MRLDARKEYWDSMNIRGVEGYFSNYRIDRDTVPDCFNFWELADADSDGEPCRYRKGILVNFFGTFITTGELPIDDNESCSGYINGEDDWWFGCEDHLTFDEVLEESSIYEPMKLEKENENE